MSKNRHLKKRPIIYGRPLVISVQYEKSGGDFTSELRAHPRRDSVLHIGSPYNIPDEYNSFTIDRSRYYRNKRITQEIIEMITIRAKDLAACLELPFIDDTKATQHLRRKSHRRQNRE